MNDQFTLAQQAGEVAYAMTLEQTGDVAQASDAYKAVMTAYFEADAKRQQPAYDREWFQREVIDARNADAAHPDQQYASLPQLTGTATVYNDWKTFIAACDDLDGYGMMGDTD